MTQVEKNIIKSYTKLFEGLNPLIKLELLEDLKKSVRKNKASTEEEFYKSFGAFDSNKSAEELIKEIKEDRKFKIKDLKL